MHIVLATLPLGRAALPTAMAVAGTAAPLAAPAGDDKTYWASLYRGPLLLAYDRALNGGDAARRTGLDGDDLRPKSGRTDRAARAMR